MLVLVFLVLIILCPFQFCNHLDEEGEAGCFAYIVFQMSCFGNFSVPFLQGAMGWSAVYAFGIS